MSSFAEPNAEVSKNSIFLFLGLTFFIGYAAQIAAIYFGKSAGGNFIVLAMWAPAIAAILSGREIRKFAFHSLKKIGIRYWGWALVFGWLPSIIALVIYWLFDFGSLNVEKFLLDSETNQITIQHLGTALGNGPHKVGIFTLNYFFSIALAAILFAPIFGIGEELGWRGALQPTLLQRLSFHKTCLLVGVIWAAWHIPINLSGYNDSAHPVWTTFFFFPLYVVGHAYAYGWLSKESGSAWPAAIAHMANNSIESGQIFKSNSWIIEKLTMTFGMGITVAVVILLSYKKAVKR